MGITFDAELLTPDGWASPEMVDDGVGLCQIGYLDDMNRLAWRPLPTLRRVPQAQLVHVRHQSWYNYLDYRVGPGTYIPVLLKKPGGRPRRVPAADIYDMRADGKGGNNLRWYHLFGLMGAADKGGRPDLVDWYVREGVTGGRGSGLVDISQVRKYAGYIPVDPPPQFASLALLAGTRHGAYQQQVEVPQRPAEAFRLTGWEAARLVEVAAHCEVTGTRRMTPGNRISHRIDPITTYYGTPNPDLLQLAHLILGLGSTVDSPSVATGVTGRAGALVGVGAEVTLEVADAWWIDEPRPLLRRNGRVLVL